MWNLRKGGRTRRGGEVEQEGEVVVLAVDKGAEEGSLYRTIPWKFIDTNADSVPTPLALRRPLAVIA